MTHYIPPSPVVMNDKAAEAHAYAMRSLRVAAFNAVAASTHGMTAPAVAAALDANLLPVELVLAGLVHDRALARAGALYVLPVPEAA